MDDNNVTPAAPIIVFGTSISILLVTIGFQVRFKIFRSPDKRSMENEYYEIPRQRELENYWVFTNEYIVFVLGVCNISTNHFDKFS